MKLKQNILVILYFLLPFFVIAQNKIPEDKALHLSAGCATSMVTYTIVYDITKDKKKALVYSLLSSILIGTLKELKDSRQPNNYFDVNDIIYTSSGGLVGSLTLDLFNNYKKQKNAK